MRNLWAAGERQLKLMREAVRAGEKIVLFSGKC